MRAKPEKRIERQSGKPSRGPCSFPEVGGRAGKGGEGSWAQNAKHLDFYSYLDTSVCALSR